MGRATMCLWEIAFVLDAADVQNDARHYQQEAQKEHRVAAGKGGESGGDKCNCTYYNKE